MKRTEIKEQAEKIKEYQNLIREQNHEIKDNEDKIIKLERVKDNLLRNRNDRAKLIRDILNIIKGEAQPLSKYEVIRDMFLPQLNEKHHTNPYISRNFLSDEVVEGGYL